MLTRYSRRNYALTKAAKAAVYTAAGYAARPTPNQLKKVASTLRSMQGSKASKNTAPAQPLKGKSVKPVRKKKTFRSKTAKKMNTCEKAIKELRQSEKASLGIMKYRNRVVQNRLLCGINAQNALDINPIGTFSVEGVLTNLKFYDPSNPGTLITASGSAGTYQRNVLIKSISSKVLLRNNYQSDVKITMYHCKVKDDTNQLPKGAWNYAIADGGNAGTINALSQYPTDYNLVNDLWKLKVLTKTTLSPGQSVECAYQTDSFEYDSSTVDTHPLSYQNEYNASSCLVVVEGTVSHDTSLDQQGLCEAGVDISYQNTYVVSYNAGININYIHVDNSGVNTPTNGFVQGHQPTSDNQAYSLS